MLRIVADKCTVFPDKSRGTMVVESDLSGPPFTEAFAELDSQEAREMAQAHAAQMGIIPAHINGVVAAPFPVNADGLSLDEIKEPGTNASPPQTDPRMQPHHYRIDVPVTRPFR